MADDEQYKSLFAVGILINIFGNVTINAGANMINHANQASKVEEEGSSKCWRAQNVKRLGWFLFISGNCLSFVSFAFAAQTLLSGFGSIQFVTNVIFGWFRGVPPTLRQVVGTVCIIAGNMLVVQAANKDTERYTSTQLKTFFWTTSYLVYTGITTILALTLQFLHNHMLDRSRVSKMIAEEEEYQEERYSYTRFSHVSNRKSNSYHGRFRPVSNSNENRNTNSIGVTKWLESEAPLNEKPTSDTFLGQTHQQSPKNQQEAIPCLPIPSPRMLPIPATISLPVAIREVERSCSFEQFFPLPRPVREKSDEHRNNSALSMLMEEEQETVSKLQLPKDSRPPTTNPHHLPSYGVPLKDPDDQQSHIKLDKSLLLKSQSYERPRSSSRLIKKKLLKRSFDAITSGDIESSERTKKKSWIDPEIAIPLLYTMSSALVGTQSAVYAKCLSSLVVLSTTGNSQMKSWFTWVVLILWSLFMVFWLSRMNTALRRFHGGFIIPLLQVLWIIGCLSCGGIFFQEFWGFNWKKWLLFGDGIVCVCIGVYLLGNSMAPESSNTDTFKKKTGFSRQNSLSRRSLMNAVSSVRRISLGSPPILSLEHPGCRKLPPTETSPLREGKPIGVLYT